MLRNCQFFVIIYVCKCEVVYVCLHAGLLFIYNLIMAILNFVVAGGARFHFIVINIHAFR